MQSIPICEVVVLLDSVIEADDLLAVDCGCRWEFRAMSWRQEDEHLVFPSIIHKSMR